MKDIYLKRCIIFVNTSINSGATWSVPVTVGLDNPALGPVDPNFRFNDRCQMSADTSGKKKFFSLTFLFRENTINHSESLEKIDA
jgi:hypothetical protein